MSSNVAYNADCMEIMRQYPDKYFDLAVVAPPYGGGASGKIARTGGTWHKKYGDKIKSWDVAPGEDYFAELFRISQNQIIWSGNYFPLPPNRCFFGLGKNKHPRKIHHGNGGICMVQF